MSQLERMARHLGNLVVAACVAISASSATAATVDYQWILENGTHSLTGWFEGLVDDTAGQSVTGFGISESTMGITGVFDIADADKNGSFDIRNGTIFEGQLKFTEKGKKSVDAPRFEFELNWKSGNIHKAEFKFDNGLEKVELDFEADSNAFSVYEPPIIITDPPTDLPPVPLPAPALLLLGGIGGLASMRFWQRKRAAV